MVVWGRGAPWALRGLVGRAALRHAPCCCCLLELSKGQLAPNHRGVTRGCARLALLWGWGWRVLLLLVGWTLHWDIKEAGAGWVAAATHHCIWVTPHAVLLLLEACAAACACWALLLLLAWLIIVTVTAQEGQVILILALQHSQQSDKHNACNRAEQVQAQVQQQRGWCRPCRGGCDCNGQCRST